MPDDFVEGLLLQSDERQDGQLRDPLQPLRPIRPGGCVVPRRLIADLGLRPGLLIKGHLRGRAVGRVEAIEGVPIAQYEHHQAIYDSTALDPSPQLRLEHNPQEYSTRIIDLLTPIGFGQRGLIIAPPRVGKTILLQNIARGIHANYPQVELVLLLIDERPEEVTDMKRNVPGTVFASSNDNNTDKHLELAKVIIERCKRKVEGGKDVVVLLDSLTRLSRAFNAGSNSGRTMSGGVDSKALEVPKRLFGSARKLEEGGSLTIIATCLVDTGSRMDQVIFEEFKGTGNMELSLDRKLADQRIFPAINVLNSGTRKEELLLDPKQLLASRNIRKHLLGMNPQQGLKSLTDALKKTKTNADLFASIGM